MRIHSRGICCGKGSSKQDAGMRHKWLSIVVAVAMFSLGIVVALAGSGFFQSEEEFPSRFCKTNEECGFRKFCQKRWANCNGRGECRDTQQGAFMADLLITCGCDGKVYDNPAIAHSLGVNIRHAGECWW